MKIKKCMGCGISLQSKNKKLDGFVEEENISSFNLCNRCFRIKHYNENIKTNLNNEDFLNIIKNIEKEALKVYIIDLFDFDMEVIKSLAKNTVLVINKIDLIPRSVTDQKLINYFKDTGIKNIFVVSAKNNYNIDYFYNFLKEQDKNIYFIGNTNAGKSSLINKLLENYGNKKDFITTSYYPATTLDVLKIEVNSNLTLFDMPGLINKNSIIYNVDFKELKSIIPKKEIKARTFQISKETSFLVDDSIRIDTNSENSFTFYISNSSKVKINSFKNEKLKNFSKKSFNLKAREDLVVNGYFWIKVTKDCKIDIYIDEKIEINIRKSII